MKRTKSLSSYIFFILRKIGLLCKKNIPTKPLRVKIQKTLNHKGEVISHEDFMFAKNHLPHVHKLNKDKKICHYDFRTHKCRCGIDLVQLKEGKRCSLENNNI
jgi:hypothetical protein